MIKPRLDTLLERVDSHYACVLVAAKRARQINSYYHNLGEGTFDEYPPPMVDTGSKNYLKIALEEIAAGKIKYRYRCALQPRQLDDRHAGTDVARILLGVTGGIAAYKAVELVAARHQGRPLRARACRRRARLELRRAGHLRGRHRCAVLVDEFEPRPRARRLSRAIPRPTTPRSPTSSSSAAADVFVIAPARRTRSPSSPTGMADNLLTTPALACTGPLVLAPAMNDQMCEHPATQANLERLRARGARIVPPGHRAARLARASAAWAGWPSPPTSSPRSRRLLAPAPFAPRSLDGLRVLVTAGGTREPIDSVRYVGNRSSGRMGFAARRGGGAARRRGDARRRERGARAADGRPRTST